MLLDRLWGEIMLRKLRNHRGSGVIEFLGIMPLVILIALMVWQFAIVGYGIINTQAAARDGVRVAATKFDEENIRKTIKTSFGEDTKYYRLDPADIHIDINNDNGSVEALITVNASFFTVLLPESVVIPFSWKVTAPIVISLLIRPTEETVGLFLCFFPYNVQHV